MPSFAKSGGAKDRRGAKAREEMRKKGYLQTCELAQKLSAELGRKVTVCSLRSHHSRGRIQGVLHGASNIWFFPADTKFPGKMYSKLPDKRTVKNPKQEQETDEPGIYGNGRTGRHRVL